MNTTKMKFGINYIDTNSLGTNSILHPKISLKLG